MGKVQHNYLLRFYGSICNFLRMILFQVLSFGPIPKHIAFIMDGNRRFARVKKLHQSAGHRAGFTALIFILKCCYEMGVKYVTIYAFSIDNFNRKPHEVQSIMDLMKDKMNELLREESIVNRYSIKVNFFGNLKLLEDSVQEAAHKVMAMTSKNIGPVLSICIAYTSTDEILHSVQDSCEEIWNKFRRKNKEGKEISVPLIEHFREENSRHDLISANDLNKKMYTDGCPDPDILIRTSGETRLSNFLLWQTTFCHLLSPLALWPEISLRHLVWSILEYQRNRSYLEKKKWRFESARQERPWAF